MFIKSVTQTQFEAFKKRRNAGRKTLFFKTALRSLLPLGVLVLLWLVLNRSLPNEEVFIKVFSQNHEISLSVP